MAGEVEPTEEPCAHRSIEVFSPIGADGAPGVWACRDCRLRFYPACRECVDVGHRSAYDHVRKAPVLNRVSR